MIQRLHQPVLYPRAYGLYVTLAALDILFTWSILALKGSEVNQIAAWIIDQHGIMGVTFFKFGTVTFVLFVCEFLGRYQDGELGRRLVCWAVIISVVPVTVAVIQLTSTDVLHNRIAARDAGHGEPVFLWNIDAAHPE